MTDTEEVQPTAETHRAIKVSPSDREEESFLIILSNEQYNKDSIFEILDRNSMTNREYKNDSCEWYEQLEQGSIVLGKPLDTFQFNHSLQAVAFPKEFHYE